MRAPELVIITGLSGAGKSTAMRAFEELGYFTVDNMPPALLPTFVDMAAHSERPVQYIAAVVDVRGGVFFEDIRAALARLDEGNVRYRILFLDADTDALVLRFKEHRFPHPLSHRCDSLLECIQAERNLLEELKGRADVVLHTTDESARQLRDEIIELFPADRQQHTIHVVAFGYKYGVPPDVDYVFDCRFLRNPHHDPELRPFTGEDPRVRAYVEEDERLSAVREHLTRLLDFAVEQHWQEGRSYVSIGVGCTGGKHRSVVMAQDLAEHFRAQGQRVVVQYRDQGRE